MKITQLTARVALLSALGALPALNSALGQVILVDPHTAVTATMDGGTARTGNTWYEVGVNTAGPTTGLKTGLVTSQADTNSSYEIQPAAGLNAFLLDGNNKIGRITLETPVALYGFSFAGSDGNGSATVTPTLEFTDGTSATLAPLTFGDWFNNTPIVYTTVGRIDLDPANSFNNTNAANPRVLAINVTNTAADAAKMISSISFAWKGSGTTTHTCIFALSGDTNGMGHYTPIALTADSYNQDMIVGVAEVSHNAYVARALVSDQAGVAPFTDTNLVNPWGIVTSASSPFWVSDNLTGLSTVYNSTGLVESLVVTVPTPTGTAPPSSPTGIIYNGTTNFVVPVGGSNAPAHFIFATQQGTISGWASGLTQAVLEVDNSAGKALYDGLAIGSAGTNATYYLYAANFHAGTIDVFDSDFKAVTTSPPLTTNGVPFTDTNVPAGFAPFNVQAIGTNLYVTYAMQDTNTFGDVQGPGNGYVDIFDTTGDLLKRFATNGPLNSPWGLALAPASFGSFAGALLVGNFGDGKINAFDATLGTPLGPLLGTNGSPLVIGGLWGLIPGNGGNGGATNMVYFTAATSRAQNHGLLGSIAFETNQTAGVPWELLQTVNGFQDDFNLDTTINTNWAAVAVNDPTPDQYELADGVLRIFTSVGDPNHLLCMAPGYYSNSVQEVLARIRVVGFETNADGPRGGIAAAVTTNAANPSRGINLEFRDSKSDSNESAGTNQPERKFKFLYDGLTWGPSGLEANGVEVGWTNNVWYWMRLRQDSKASGTNDVFGKVWPSDGVTPEPAEWQMVWDYVPAHVLSTGFAGLAGASGNGFAQLETDYVLIKANGLPSVKVDFGVFGPPLNPPVVTGITHTNKTVTVEWFGGSYLESATSVLGPWSLVPNPTGATYSPLTLTETNAQEFFRVGR
jgi:uncharacterized protein (TIGR03118 family)